MLTHDQQQLLRRQASVPYVPNAAPSRNLAKAVVVVAEVLGSEIAEALVTQNFVTRGTRAFGLAKHGRSLRQPSASRCGLVSKNTMALLMMQSSPLSTHFHV